MGGESFMPTFLRALPLARDALAFAERVHGGQRRDSDQAAFVLHPIEVAALLHNAGHAEPVVVAGILHETIEAGHTDPDEIRSRFGAAVSDMVQALTGDSSIRSFDKRKAGLRRQVSEFDADAIAVEAADKVTKVRELRAHAGTSRQVLSGDDGQRRLAHYDESLVMLEQHARDHPLVRQLRFELEALRAMPLRRT
jgi:(p)ppGpp synthase/HD superfamily hydrolase